MASILSDPDHSISATRRNARAFDRRYWLGKLWPRWSWTAERLNWNVRYKAWLADNRPIKAFKDRLSMYRAIVPPGPITYLEFGVAKGESMMQWLSLNKHEESRFHGFDSWEGMPKVEGSPFKEGEFLSDPPVIGDARCTLHKGWFADTLPALRTKKWKNTIINLDADNYGPTSYVLHTLKPQSGAILMLDEASVAEHEFRALIDWIDASGRKDPRKIEVIAGWRHGRRVKGVAIQVL